MMISVVCFLVMCIGAVVAVIPNRASTIGGYAFAVALWYVLAMVAGHVVRV